jgi:hypothetical protein
LGWRWGGVGGEGRGELKSILSIDDSKEGGVWEVLLNPPFPDGKKQSSSDPVPVYFEFGCRQRKEGKNLNSILLGILFTNFTPLSFFSSLSQQAILFLEKS